MSETTHHQPVKSKGYLAQLEDFLDLYLVKKAPAIPKGGREFIVKIAPWLVIVGLVLTIPGIFALFGLSSFMTANPYGAAVGYALGPAYYASIIFLIVAVILEIMALPGLFAKKRSGWNYIFYATIVSAVSNIVSLNIVGAIIGGLIGFYILFQVREYYK